VYTEIAMAQPEQWASIFEETETGLIVHMPSELDECKAATLADVIADKIGNGYAHVTIDLRETLGRQALTPLIIATHDQSLKSRKRVVYQYQPHSDMSRYFDEMRFVDKNYQVEEIPTDPPGISQP
jgi:hypothetical protein